MRNGILLAIAGLVFLAGCDIDVKKAPEASTQAQFKAPYHIEFDTKAPKANPTGLALPAISYTANSKALEKRAVLVVRFEAPAKDASGPKAASGTAAPAVKNEQTNKNQLVMAAIDIEGTGGFLPGNYMELTDQKLAKMLADRCIKGPVNVTVVLVRSSIRPDPGDAEINAKRLSDWVPTTVTFKDSRPKCVVKPAA